MAKILAGLVLFATVALSVAPLRAHHSFTAEFDQNKNITLKGTLTKVEFTKAKRTPVLIEMNWNGKAITGSISPDADRIAFTKADVDYTNWAVHLEAQSGAVKYVIDGKVENLGSLSRSILGTWTQGNQKGDFKITKQ